MGEHYTLVQPLAYPYLSGACHEGGAFDQTFDQPGKPHSAGITAIRGSGLIGLASGFVGLRPRVIAATQGMAAPVWWGKGT
jgi:hypothetical protein